MFFIWLVALEVVAEQRSPWVQDQQFIPRVVPSYRSQAPGAFCCDLDPFVHMPVVIPDVLKVMALKPVQQSA